MFINVEVAARLRSYIWEDQPFGPPDADGVNDTDPECAAALFDWNNEAFAELLRGSGDVIVGRRGSGKSSLLNTFATKRFLTFSPGDAKEYVKRHHLSASTLKGIPDVVVKVDTAGEVDRMDRYRHERQSVPVEKILERKWTSRFWMLVGETIRDNHNALWHDMPPKLRAVVDATDIVDRALDDAPAPRLLTDVEFAAAFSAWLQSKSICCTIAIDNLERYKLQEVQNAVLAGLIAATGRFVRAQHPVLNVKLCLPAEVYDRLREASFRADKDLHAVQYMHWSPFELMHLAARRLRVFLAVYDREQCNHSTKGERLGDRTTLRQFWLQYLPERVTNSLGTKEDVFAYILRHTHMLPRQVLTLLTAISRRAKSHGRVMFAEPFTEQEVLLGVQDVEETNCVAVLGMFQPMHRNLRQIFDAVIPRLTRLFTYGDLHSVYNSSAKVLMDPAQGQDFQTFWRLMLATGAIGVVISPQAEGIYAEARFEFNSRNPLRISDKDWLCIHPMFSRVYNAATGDNHRVILPRGSDFVEEWQRP